MYIELNWTCSSIYKSLSNDANNCAIFFVFFRILCFFLIKNTFIFPFIFAGMCKGQNMIICIGKSVNWKVKPLSPKLYAIRARSCTGELQMKVNCRLKMNCS